MEKKLENMTKKELIERINDLETQCEDKDVAFASLHDQYTKFGVRAAQDIDALTKKNADLIEELKKKNEAIHEEAKRWKKEAVDAQAELDDLRSAIGADDSDPISVAIWKAKYHTLKYQFDKLKEEDRKWTSANPAVQAALERKINVLEKEINKYKALASEWEAKYEYQDGQTDCVIKDYNELNKKYTALLAEHEVLSSKYNDMVKYFESRSDKKYLEELVKDLIRQCDELYDKLKDAEDLENAMRKDLREFAKENKFLRSELCSMHDMILAYDLDVNSYDDSSIEGITKIVNTVRGGHIWLDALENSMKKFSEEAEKYIKKVGGKND